MKKVFICLSFMAIACISKSQKAPLDHRTVTDCGYSDQNFAEFSMPPYSMFIAADEHISDHTSHYDNVNHTWCADWIISCNGINENFSVKSNELSCLDTYTHKYEVSLE